MEQSLGLSFHPLALGLRMYRDPRLRGLSNDHHQALVLARTLVVAAKQGGDDLVSAGKELAERFESELDPHFIVEEDVLLPPLLALGEHALIERTELDHAYLREGARLAALGQTDHLAAYGERLADHVRFEERELFERCQELLSDDILDVVWERRPKV